MVTIMKYDDILKLIFVVAAIFGLLFVLNEKADRYLDLKKSELKAQAVQGCMNVSRYETHDEKQGITSVTYMNEPFTKCLNQIGYE